MHRLSTALLSTAVLAATCAPGAAAATKVAQDIAGAQPSPNTKVTLVDGGRVIYATGGQWSRHPTIRSVPVGGGRPTTLVELTPTPGIADAHPYLSFAAAGGRIVINKVQLHDKGVKINEVPISDEVVGGPIGGPYTRLDGCPTYGSGGRELYASPTAFAWAQPGCEFVHYGIAGPSGQLQTRNADAAFFALGGPYMAFNDLEHNHIGERPIVVRDVATGQDRYRLQRYTQGFDAARTRPLLQPDGKLLLMPAKLVTDTGACDYKAAWFAPDQPDTARVLPFGVCGGDAAFAGDRVVLARRGPSGAELVSVGLDGGDPKVLARFAHPDVLLNVDSDGTRVAWQTRECGTDAVWVATLGVGAPVPAGPADCDATVLPGPLKVDRRGRIAVRVASRSGVQHLSLTFVGAAKERFGTSAMQRVAKGTTRTITVQAGPQTRTALREAGRASVKLYVQHEEIAGRASFPTQNRTLLLSRR